MPRRNKKGDRGKEEQWGLIAEKKIRAGETELLELRTLENLGSRRRRRWLNDKVLRDMAGPMSASMIESMFKPVPWGEPGPASSFMVAMQPQNFDKWQSFCQIDMNKEQQFLEVMEAKRKEHSSNRQGTGAAWKALQQWSDISRELRFFLKRANLRSVTDLEFEMLDDIEQDGDSGAPPASRFPIETAFGKKVIEGLAQYHALGSRVIRRQGAADAVEVFQRQRAAADHQGSPLCPILCSDVLAAMATCGPRGFNHHVLQRYVDVHVHLPPQGV